ncbi:MAG: MFS transporter [Chloroflexota bacterium]
MLLRHNSTPKYYGWYIAVTLAITETISWGVLYYSFSVFLTPMQTSLGWSRAQLTGGFSLSLLVTGAMAFPVGAWIDRYGPRLLMTVGAISASILVIAWSQVTDLTAFYLIWIGLGMSAAAVLYEPAFTVIAQWFTEQRGTALAVITFAAGLASTIFLPLSDAFLRSYGWRTAVFLLGIFLAVMTIPLHAMILRHHPNETAFSSHETLKPTTVNSPGQQDVSFRTAMHSRVFWLLALGFGLAYLSATAIRVHFIPFLISVGVESGTAAFVTGAIGIMQVAGRVVFAPLERRWSATTIVIGVFALQAMAMAVLLIGQTPFMLGLFIIIFGVSQGATTLSRPAILAQLYGRSHYGRISSVMAVCLTLASTAAPLGASLLFDLTGNYQPILWIVLVFALCATSVTVITKGHISQDQRHTVDNIRSVLDPAQPNP